MNIEINTIRLLGLAQLIVFISALLSDRLLASVVGSDSISDILVKVSKNLTRMRISILAALVDSIGIVVLAVLFYTVFYEQFKIIAFVALGFFLAEAITLAVSKMGAYALIPLSKEFVEAGAPETSYFQTMGDFLYYGVDRQGYLIHNLFFSLGAILWYSLFLRSGFIPQLLSIWGLAAILLFTIYVLLTLYDHDFPPIAGILALPYLPFELVLGLWLIVMGFN
ncbi:MAG: DUF4386 domain-containing protein [Chloroflexi bacterium]|nr:DUF4386 domain-containing protein [Chloroflexota bacterium]